MAQQNNDLDSAARQPTRDDIPDLLAIPESAVHWLEQALPRIMRKLIDSENLDMPLLQLPLAQMRLAQALYKESGVAPDTVPAAADAGDTMGQLSERLRVRQNALTQAADRLINHGLAERVSDSRDRRVVRLRLTEKGRTWVQARRERRRAHLSKLWLRLSAAERTEFLEAVWTLDAVGRQIDAEESEAQFTDSDARPLTLEETLARLAADLGAQSATPTTAIVTIAQNS